MGGVEADGESETLHDGDGAHVADEIVVTKGGPPVGEEDVFLSAGGEFVDDVFHVPRGEKLPFFDIDGGGAVASCDDQVCLSAEESGDLDHVGNFSDNLRLFGGVDVCDDGEVQLILDFLENFEPFIHPRSTERVDRGAVRFVVRGFEDKLEGEVAEKGFELFGCAECELFSLHDAGAANDGERMLFPDDEIPNDYFLHKG